MNYRKPVDQFMIFADVPPIPTADRLEKYSEAGFTCYNLTEDYIKRDSDGKNGEKITPEYYGAIDLCHKLGLKVILRTMRGNSPDYYDGITDEFIGKADGYYICDEPTYDTVDWFSSATEISKLPKLVDWYNEFGGDTFFHINLLQDYGIKMLHKGVTFEQYVDEYVETVLKKVKGEKTICTDHYPLSFDENGIKYLKETVLKDYYIIAERAAALKSDGHNVRTGFCIQLTSDKGLKLREPECEADITFQLNLAAAFGASVLEYYLYVGVNTGIITDIKEQASYSPLYEYVKKANGDINFLAKDFLKYHWNCTKVFTGKELADKHNLNAFALVADRQTAKFDKLKHCESSADAVVSELKSGNDTAYMAVNYTEPTSGTKNTVTLHFTDDVKKISAVKSGKKEEFEIADGKFTVTLLPGEGIFIEIKI